MSITRLEKGFAPPGVTHAHPSTLLGPPRAGMVEVEHAQLAPRSSGRSTTGLKRRTLRASFYCPEKQLARRRNTALLAQFSSTARGPGPAARSARFEARCSLSSEKLVAGSGPMATGTSAHDFPRDSTPVRAHRFGPRHELPKRCAPSGVGARHDVPAWESSAASRAPRGGGFVLSPPRSPRRRF